MTAQLAIGRKGQVETEHTAVCPTLPEHYNLRLCSVEGTENFLCDVAGKDNIENSHATITRRLPLCGISKVNFDLR